MSLAADSDVTVDGDVMVTADVTAVFWDFVECACICADADALRCRQQFWQFRDVLCATKSWELRSVPQHPLQSGGVFVFHDVNDLFYGLPEKLVRAADSDNVRRCLRMMEHHVDMCDLARDLQAGMDLDPLADLAAPLSRHLGGCTLK
jgi:hypothetical protein